MGQNKMKNVSTKWIVLKSVMVAAVSISSVPLMAQSASISAQQRTSAQAGGAQASESSDIHGSAAVEMRPVTGELQGKLDSKTAKVGDSVVVKTKAAVKTADGTAIPKGARLFGHITDVQAHESGNAEGRLGILFDHAELKGGQSLAIHSIIQAVEPPVNLADSASASGDESLGGAGLSGGVRSTGSARAGGGGLLGSAVGGVAGTTANVGSGLETGVGNTTGSASHLAGNTATSVGSSVHEVAGVSGGVVAHGTGIPGLSLASGATIGAAGSVSGSTSGTLFAAKKNVHLEGGTQLVLGVATATSAR